MAGISKADLRWTLSQSIKAAESSGATIAPDIARAARGETKDGVWNLLLMIQQVERACGLAEAGDGTE
jgi:hypothetical protein